MSKASADKMDRDIGAFIRERRYRKKMSQPDLAEALGVSPMAVQHYETGRSYSYRGQTCADRGSAGVLNKGPDTVRLIRVFPRKTRATPIDALAYFGPPDMFAEADEIHVSVTFTQDKAIAERMAEQWKFVAPVKIGGVAYEDTSLEFIPARSSSPAIRSHRAAVRGVAGSAGCGKNGQSPIRCRFTMVGTCLMTIYWLARATMSRPSLPCYGVSEAHRDGLNSLAG